MASIVTVAFGLTLVLALWIQGSICNDQYNALDIPDNDVSEPNAHRVPEKVEHGEEGSVKYKINSIKLSGKKHVKMDAKKPIPSWPPWPPRPGKRNAIPQKATRPGIFRPGRSIMAAPQRRFRPGREDAAQRASMLRSVTEVFPNRPPSFRSGREDVPEGPPTLIRLSREDVPARPPLFRPGREDVPARPPLFRPGREDVPARPPLFRPGREDVPERPQYLFRPSREDISRRNDQFHTMRPGRRGYNMPWTFTGNSLNSHILRSSHTFRQKALEETAKRDLDDQPQESDSVII